MDSLVNHTCVVTGGSSGIGRRIACEFATWGADVIVADHVAEPKAGGTPTHERIESETDRRASFVECDVSDVSAIEAAVVAAEEYGGIDVMVNNAGIWRPEDFLAVTEAEYHQVMDVNLKGVYFGSQAAARHMVDNGGGSILNISSIAGRSGNGGYPTSTAARAGMTAMTSSLAHALGPSGIRVNAIHPGVIETEIGPEDYDQLTEEQQAQLTQLIPLGGLGQSTDVANVAVFLASDLAGYITGESIVVDGGWTTGW